MNISLTWANFALITGVCLVGYYLFIGLVYYRKDLLRLLQPKKAGTIPIAHHNSPAATKPEHFQFSSATDNAGSDETEPVNIMPEVAQPTVEDFMDEIYACTEACGNNVSKKELGENISKILLKYPSLISSSLRNVLAGVIAAASQTNCSIQWREDELDELWNG